ncbi:hypothetical protein D0C16_13015 [Cellvibrio sp. KY-GH-1]|uniref:hypothetical protein n=1 Tax=Cellvibrio sp. KY-GH-1 TaxID=2303332 RepID=UPI00124769E9|nr:hypothetical protein [Cellvibrio sp. KY-GH-1]QEY16810.1 hypothetical protein D0C16_13015 [Cellvibrio sp. KY-GH-1]
MKLFINKFIKKGGETAFFVLIFLAITLAFFGGEDVTKDDLIIRINALHGVVLAWIFWVFLSCLFEK